MIKAGDPSSFRLYHNFLLKYQSKKSNQSWNVLDFLKTLSLVISKFPRHISGKKNRQALTIRIHHVRGLSLLDIIAFEKETILVNDPMFSNNAVEIYLGKTKESAQKRMKYFTTKTEEQKSQEEVRSRCLICNENHDLDPCNQYFCYAW